jgi:hypothetical protein
VKYKPIRMKELLKHLARLYMPVYQFESNTLKIIYAGYSKIKKSYYTRLLLNDTYHQTFLGRYWFSNIPNLIDRLKIDMIVAEISPATFTYFRNYNGYILPIWATMRINIDRPASEIFNKRVTNFRDVTRRIRKYALTDEISSDREMFDFFKERFYHPYMEKRHAGEAFIEDLDTMWKSADHPLMMAVKEKNKIVGMVFMEVSGDTIYLKRVGLIDGNNEYLVHGVLGAFYYFGILEGLKRGCKFVDLGGSRPFLTDGLTIHKKSMGGEFLPDPSQSNEYHWFGVNERSPAALEYVNRNPFMHLNKDLKLVRCHYGEHSKDSCSD